jgi:glycosyltransferase involved in cell wall biosynthesis
VKGYDVLVAALAKLRQTGTPYEVVIGGEGTQREAIEAAAREAGVNALRLAGYVQDPRAFLSGLHLYVQPSRSEGFCVAAHEAMQAGLPVIASAVGELQNSIVDRQTGWTTPPGDVDALAAALDEALTHPDRLAPMGMAARARILDRFGAERFEAVGQAIVERMKAF